jgi:hypothetical protein
MIRAAGEIKLIATIFLREAWQIRFHASVPPQLSSHCLTNSFHAAATGVYFSRATSSRLKLNLVQNWNKEHSTALIF